MSKIKVTVKDLDQANEIIEYWKDKDVELLVDIKPNGTFFNSGYDREVNLQVLAQALSKSMQKAIKETFNEQKWDFY